MGKKISRNPIRTCTGKKKNCVSSVYDDKTHFLEPIRLTENDNGEVMTEIGTYLQSAKRTKVVDQGLDYIHCVFTSKWLRFKDDVEVYYDRGNQLIHFRSASRTGFYDMGVNRKRMKRMKEYINELQEGRHPAGLGET